MNDMPTVLQIGANYHGGSRSHMHDPVPILIEHGWSATLIEPQAAAVAALHDKYRGNPAVEVRQEAVCAEAEDASVTLWFVNTSHALGSNHSDPRCLGDLGAIQGTASVTRKLVLQNQRFYRYTPSQCKACAARLQRPLPPNCMSRVYLDNLQNSSVPCSRLASLRTADVLIVDAEGLDAVVVRRYLQVASKPPSALVYEHAHLPGSTRLALAAHLKALGMERFTATMAKARWPTFRRWSHQRQKLGPRWDILRRVLLRVEARDNSVWLMNRSLASLE
jgi:hypothetical protein